MGGMIRSVPKDKVVEYEFSPMTSMTSQEAAKYNQTINSPEKEEGSCLLCGINSPLKKKESEVWRVDFQKYCSSMKEEFKWAQVILRAGREKKQTRINCMKEYFDLKYEFEKKIQNKEVPNSAEMRKILSSSALLEANVGDQLGPRESIRSIKSFAKASFQGKPKIVKGKKINPMVSTLDENMKSLFLPKKAPKQMDYEIESSIFLFVKFTQMIEKHTQQPSNALCRIRLSFIDYIRQTFGGLTTLTRLQDEELTNNIRQFIDVYTTLISVYYKTSSISQNDKVRFIFSYENLKSAVTVILFKSEGFYRLVFQLFESSDKEFEAEFDAIIQQKKNIKPQDLKVSPEYCLNETTVSWYLSKCSFEAGLDNIEIPTNTECQPFETCIIKLRQLEEAQTPISKLKVIISAADKISCSINRFYEINSIPLKQMVDADQILTIFIYVIIHSQLRNLKTHLRFVESFCTEEQLLSETGYYSKVVEGALRVLIDEGEDMEE